MFRYPVLLLSLLMLGLSFSSPKSHWLIDISVFGYAIKGDVHNWLFIICLLSFAPALLANIIFFPWIQYDSSRPKAPST
jgi:hypothetical protein